MASKKKKAQSNPSSAPEGLGLQSWFHQELYELDRTKSEVEREAQRLPANPIEWIETPGFLHSAEDLPPAGEHFLYPKSYEIIRDIFDLLCPYCNEDMPAIRRGEVPREEQILRRFGECPKCGVSQVDMLRARKSCFYQQVAMAVGMRAGKELAIDTPIPTPDGWKTMGELKAGDLVFDENGLPCTVVEVHPVMFNLDCYRLTFSDGHSIVASDTHPWVTTDHCGRKNAARNYGSGRVCNAGPKIRTTREIAETLYPSAGPRGGYNHHIQLTKPLQLPPQEFSVHPYVLGVWLGDGDSHAPACTFNDEQIADELRSCGENVVEKPVKDGRGRRWSMAGDNEKGRLRKRMRMLDLYKNKHIPAAYFRGSYEQRLSLLQGLMDTDGTVDTQGRCEFSVVSERLAHDVADLLVTLGIRAMCREGRAKLNGRDVGPRWRICFKTALPVFRLRRKLDRLNANLPKVRYVTSRSIVAAEKVQSVPTRCITVDSPSHLYLCGEGMIPTHNSYLAANVASWIVQQALLLPNVRRSFGLSPGPPIEIAFAASTEMQTKDTIWAAFRSIYENSPWFQRYVANLKHREETAGRELYRETDNRLEFKEIGLTLVSLNSSSGSAAGRTRLAVFLDELARFRDTAGPNSADEVYRTLQRSMRTLWAKSDRMLRIGIHPPVHPLLVAISSPMHEEDRIMRLVRDAREYPGLRIYAQHLPSWEMNPDFTIEDFEEELAADPIGARRDFGAEPMGINERLFKNPEILTAQIVPERRPILTYQTEHFEEAGFSYVAPALGSCWTDLVRRRFMHCDPGRKEDSFGISIVSVEGFPPDYTVYIDAVIEVRPEPAPKGSRMKSREVHFEQVLKFMLQLRRHLNIVKVSFDHWQQVHYVQKLRAMGFNIEEHNIEMEDYLRFASDVEAGRVKFFPPERAHYDRKLRDVPMAKAMHELKMLEKVSPRRVDHPEGGSSDIAICMVGAHRNATQSFFTDGYVRGRPQMPLNRGYHISQMMGLSGNQRVGGIVRFRR